jgi:hypothetical protein
MLMKAFVVVVIVLSIGSFIQSKPTVQQPAKVRRSRPTTSKKATIQQSTVKEILGIDKVDSVVKDVISKSTERVSSSFILTDDSFGRLRETGYSEAVLYQLGAMKDQRVEGRDRFEDAIRTKVGNDMWTQAWFKKDEILVSASTSLIVEADFVKRVEALILETRAPGHGDPKEWLEKNFQRFLTGYIVHIELTSKNKNIIILRTEGLDKYLDSLKAKCGEISCPGTPPCCGDECDPCKP